ncbi:uncharacterized protein LOC127794321 [Diospyros lotus]|uniref:uncharacterized protein LOC127794321 n=1 Tax=Diospyros lotus TaxID=55363 RepID=UPI00224EC1FC|nr:uncharacterized protein LOC127794321 [Diospyros lotus]XP_052181283.1 uncharacterized protein LOC127794321 [Diospyros lotus]
MSQYFSMFVTSNAFGHPDPGKGRFSFDQSQRENFYLLGYDPNLYVEYPSSYNRWNYPWNNDSVFQSHEPFPPPPHQFELEQGVRSDAYQPQDEKCLEDTLQEFMQGQMSFNTQVVELQEQTTRAIGDILEQLTEFTQTLSVSEPGEFPNQPNQNSIGQCLGEESSFNAPIGQESVQSIPIPRNDESIERLDDPRMVRAIIEEKLGQNAVRKEEAWEKEEDKTQEPKCEDTMGLAKLEPKFMSFGLVYIIGDQIKPNMCEVFVRIDVLYSNVIKPTPSDDIFSKYICAFMRKINLHNFENNFKTGVMNGSYYTNRWATTYLILNWKKRKKNS